MRIPSLILPVKTYCLCGDSSCQNASETLKQKLLEPPILAYPFYDGSEFILQTDASYKGLGFILAQKQIGIEKVISYGALT